MARALNHSRTNAVERMRRHGTDRIDDFGLPPEFYSPPKRRPSKADMRAELAAATAAITRTVRCRCGHSATVALPPAKLRPKLRCSKCGSIAQIEKPAGAASGGLIAELTAGRPAKQVCQRQKG
jgi:hypothetical protein